MKNNFLKKSGTKAALAIATVASLVGFLFASPAAFAGIGVSVTPDFPATIGVGQTAVPASLNITNNSSGDVGDITLTSVFLTPSCGDFSSIPCDPSMYDPGVFSLSATGTGAGACLGQTFTIAIVDAASGKVQFTPPPPPILLPIGATCTINFTFNVLKVPTKDAAPLATGIQTAQIAQVSALDQSGLPGAGSGTDITAVTKASPSISTTPSAGGPIGTVLNDTATLSGGSTPTGGVTFKLFAPADATCQAAAVYTDTDASAPYATTPGFTSTTAGTYHWTADYAGDANNNATSSPCSAETAVITKVSPTIATTLVPAGPIATGASVHDSSVLTGATASAGGTVKYSAYAGANTCSGTDLLNSTVTVTAGVVPDSANTSFASAGTYSFQAVYSGDANNNAATSTCSTEQLVVNKAAPTIATTLVPAGPIATGASVHDSSVLTGATATAGGTVKYSAYAGANTCTGTDLLNSTVTVTNGVVPDSANTSFANAGTYSFQAVYSGDANNNSATSTCSTEQLVVNKASPSISTTPVPVSASVGTLLNDTATLSGGSSPTGSVTFKLFAPADATCSGAAAYTNVDAAAPYVTSPGFASNVTGVWHWTAEYAGDANNNATSSPCSAEAVTVSKIDSSTATQVHNAAHADVTNTSVTSGTAVHDQATVSGATTTPTGNVTFNLYNSANCQEGVISSEVVALTAGVAESAATSTLAAGSYGFKASYAGDSVYNSSVGVCEPFTVIAKGHIIVDKVTNPAADPTSFTFNATGTGYSGFSLTDAATPNDQELNAGTYSVSEGAVAGWDSNGGVCVSSNQNSETPGNISLQAGETVTCTFTNTKRGSISGMKWNDANGNGVVDSGDTGLSGWVITLMGPATSTAISTTTTDGSGNYSFQNLVPGVYTVCETPQTTWMQTSPATSTPGTTSCSNATVGYSITLAAGQNSTGNNFGNHQMLQYCSPGYWKNHSGSWVGYNPNQKFSAVFGRTITIMWSSKGKPAPVTDPTLQQALEANGGGINMFARVAVDGLLNSTSMNSGFTAAQVISMVQGAIDSSNYDTVSAQLTPPENCPLN